MENLLANKVGPDQTTHHVASDLGPQCTVCPQPFFGFPGKNGLIKLLSITQTMKKLSCFLLTLLFFSTLQT